MPEEKNKPTQKPESPKPERNKDEKNKTFGNEPPVKDPKPQQQPEKYEVEETPISNPYHDLKGDQ